MSRLTLGIIAPSSKVPLSELELGVGCLKEAGFSVKVHPQCRKQSFLFAGEDEVRARAFFDYAVDGGLPVLWCARGGYGAIRILPYLDRLTSERGIPEKKLLVGYSDATALLEYVRVRWNWSSLHGPMPGGRSFKELSAGERKPLYRLVRGQETGLGWERKKLRFAGVSPEREIRGELIGGNLTVWTSMIGTPYAPQAKGKILFFEDVGEAVYRIDRMAQQLRLSGTLRDARAIVLGSFEGCEDTVPLVLPDGKGRKLVPLRKKLDAAKAIRRIFRDLGDELGIPVAYSLPVGHGKGKASLPLGGSYALSPEGRLELLRWDWSPIS